MVPMASQAVRALRPTSPPKGFSLLETLVVVAILGLVMAMAGLSLFQAADRKLQSQVDRLQAVLQTVSDRAAIMQRDHRLILSKEGFWIEEQRRGQWLQQTAFPMQYRSWETGLSFQGETAVVRIDRTGLIEPSQLDFEQRGHSVILLVDPFARVSLKQVGRQ
jgi:type II secretion system protein H